MNKVRILGKFYISVNWSAKYEKVCFFRINVYVKRFDNSLVRKWAKYYTENCYKYWQ